MSEIPVKPSRPGKYILTQADKEYLQSFAVDGVIPFDDYIRATNEILNRDIKIFCCLPGKGAATPKPGGSKA